MVCLKALVDRGEGKKGIVPYRDAVLTRVMREAIGGDCKTFAVCTVAPSGEWYEETRATLRAGSCWRKAKN